MGNLNPSESFTKSEDHELKDPERIGATKTYKEIVSLFDRISGSEPSRRFLHGTNNKGETILHGAVRNSDFQVLTFLCQQGFSCQPSKSGDTPLHLALFLGKWRWADYLFKLDPSQRDRVNTQGHKPHELPRPEGIPPDLLKELLPVVDSEPEPFIYSLQMGDFNVEGQTQLDKIRDTMTIAIFEQPKLLSHHILLATYPADSGASHRVVLIDLRVDDGQAVVRIKGPEVQNRYWFDYNLRVAGRLKQITLGSLVEIVKISLLEFGQYKYFMNNCQHFAAKLFETLMFFKADLDQPAQAEVEELFKTIYEDDRYGLGAPSLVRQEEGEMAPGPSSSSGAAPSADPSQRFFASSVASPMPPLAISPVPPSSEDPKIFIEKSLKDRNMYVEKIVTNITDLDQRREKICIALATVEGNDGVIILYSGRTHDDDQRIFFLSALAELKLEGPLLSHDVTNWSPITLKRVIRISFASVKQIVSAAQINFLTKSPLPKLLDSLSQLFNGGEVTDLPPLLQWLSAPEIAAPSLVPPPR